jgi:hypothetical protein
LGYKEDLRSDPADQYLNMDRSSGQAEFAEQKSLKFGPANCGTGQLWLAQANFFISLFEGVPPVC